MSVFGRAYSEAYDALYGDKDYAAEAEYVARILRQAAPHARSVLELGSGTGRHGRLLADRGFDVYGIERSPEMVALAHPADASSPGSFASEVGDICELDLGRRFDAVISLFHVIGYQVTNQALGSAFKVAADHLEPGGVFMFDIWHGPAVVTQRPSRRRKEVVDRHLHVSRTAEPHIDLETGTVRVVYDLRVDDLEAGSSQSFIEEHLVRYLFPTEVGLLAEASGLALIRAEEFLTAKPPSDDTWGVSYLLGKV